MLHYPESVSPETIQRAIRSHLLIRHGLDSHFVRLPLPIAARPQRESGCNWELELLPSEDAAALEAASAEAARLFSLRTN